MDILYENCSRNGHGNERKGIRHGSTRDRVLTQTGIDKSHT